MTQLSKGREVSLPIKIHNLGESCEPPAAEKMPNEEEYFVLPMGKQRVVRIKRNPSWGKGGTVLQQLELFSQFIAELEPAEAEVAFQAAFLRLLAEGKKVDLSTAINAAY